MDARLALQAFLKAAAVVDAAAKPVLLVLVVAKFAPLTLAPLLCLQRALMLRSVIAAPRAIRTNVTVRAIVTVLAAQSATATQHAPVLAIILALIATSIAKKIANLASALLEWSIATLPT